MSKRHTPLYIITFLLLVTNLFKASMVSAIDKPDMLYFFSPDCDECRSVKEEFLPGFLDSYGEHFNFVMLDVTESVYMDSLMSMEARVGVPEQDKSYPAIYFMGDIIEGGLTIMMKLEPLVNAYLANPDSMLARHEEVMARNADLFDEPVVAVDNAQSVHFAYFYKKGCKECGRALEIVHWLEDRYDNVTVTSFDIGDRDSKVIAMAMGRKTGVPDKRLMSTPSFFVGGDYVLSEDISRENLVTLVDTYSAKGAAPVWTDLTETELESARSDIASQFQSFVILAVALAGLGDGVNPCAFATILFFVSYLTMIGRKGREILIVGLSFAFAVFITYFLVGLGFSQIIARVANIDFMAKIIFGGTAVLCLIFGVLSVYDYYKVRQGKTGEMALQLPEFLKKRIHSTIRGRVRMNSMVAGALIIGFLVSILEFACTGQVYLPTITFMVGMQGYRSAAVMYLLIYNFFFIVPLLVVFGFVYFGVSSRAVAHIMENRVGTVKLALAVVFFCVAGLLFWTVF